MAERDEARAKSAEAGPAQSSSAGEEAVATRRARAQRLKPGQVPPDTPLAVIKKRARERRAAERGLHGVGGSYRLVKGRRVPA